MEIKAVVVDDEIDGRIVLEHHLTKNCENIKIKGSFSNVDDALFFLKSNSVDLVFLDINMPEKNGFDLLEEIGEYEFKIIFVTAYDEYAIKAIKYAAFDYLLKPINPEELKSSLERLENTSFNKKKLSVLTQNLNQETVNQLALPTRDGYFFLKISNIIRCEGDSNYCKIHSEDGKKHVVSKTLKSIQELLPPQVFFRIHKSNIINVNHVKKFNKSQKSIVTLTDDSEVEVSRRNKEAFLNHMKSL